VGPAGTLLQGVDSSTALKTILIEHFHTGEQEAARERFSEDRLRESAEKLVRQSS
jgi:hypothetical protein